jgi:hypothetical protein
MKHCFDYVFGRTFRLWDLCTVGVVFEFPKAPDCRIANPLRSSKACRPLETDTSAQVWIR